MPLPAMLPLLKIAAPYAAMALPSIVNLFSSSGGNGSKDEMMAAIGPVAKKLSEDTGISEEEATKALSQAMMPHVERMGGGGMSALESLATIAGIAVPGYLGYKAVRGAMAGGKALGETATVAGGKVAATPVTGESSPWMPTGSATNIAGMGQTSSIANMGAKTDIRGMGAVSDVPQRIPMRQPQAPPSVGSAYERGFELGPNNLPAVRQAGVVPAGPVQTRIGRGMEQLPDTGNVRTYDVENLLGPSRQGSPYLSAPQEFPKLSNAALDEDFQRQLMRARLGGQRGEVVAPAFEQAMLDPRVKQYQMREMFRQRGF